MDEDYKNFVGRMGSFDDTIDLDSMELADDPVDNHLAHSGKIFVDSILEYIGTNSI